MTAETPAGHSLRLDTGWTCRSTDPGVVASPRDLADLPGEWISAQVPGTAAGAMRDHCGEAAARAIAYDDLIGARYCKDEASCRSFVEQNGCTGHYSWTVIFKQKR